MKVVTALMVMALSTTVQGIKLNSMMQTSGNLTAAIEEALSDLSMIQYRVNDTMGLLKEAVNSTNGTNGTNGTDGTNGGSGSNDTLSGSMQISMNGTISNSSDNMVINIVSDGAVTIDG